MRKCKKKKKKRMKVNTELEKKQNKMLNQIFYDNKKYKT